MKRLQQNSFGKLLACLLLIAGTFLGTFFGVRMGQALPYVTADTYQQTQMYNQLIDESCRLVSEVFYCQQQLEQGTHDYIERHRFNQRLEELNEKLDASKTNFCFRVKTQDGQQTVMDNLHYLELSTLVDQVEYLTFVPGELLQNDYYWNGAHHYYYDEADISDSASQYILEYGVRSDAASGATGIQDDFTRIAQVHYQEEQMFTMWCTLTGICAAVVLIAALYLLWTAGHKKGVDGIDLSWQDNIWLEAYLFVSVCLVTMFACLLVLLLEESWWMWNQSLLSPALQEECLLVQIGSSLLTVAIMVVLVLTIRTFVVRLKARALLRTTLLCHVCSWCLKKVKFLWHGTIQFVRTIPFLWRTLLILFGYLFTNTLLIDWVRYGGPSVPLWLILSAAVVVLVCWWAMGFHKVRKGCAAIAAGNLSHQIDLKYLPNDLKEHAQDLNNLSGGMQNAVNEQMKSERFKSELITNVSHDLKTPLTSIINYVDLLKSTQQTDPKAEEYIQVLDRKAQRLKKLTEDLVEASKASTGALNVCREKIGMNQLIDQALGEYAEKLEGRHLQVISSLPEEETYVHADGRHLWRVLDNLLSNCCKYAMEGTRVYLELSRSHGQVMLSLKNISREPLNIPAAQLMERFVRGEESRSSEGSGLGLSIARSLTELQGGKFELTVDGDLFKAVVTMPQAG